MVNKRIGKVAPYLPIKGFLYKEEDFKINSRCYTKPVQIQCANKNAFMSFLKVESLVCQTPLGRSKIVTNQYETIKFSKHTKYVMLDFWDMYT